MNLVEQMDWSSRERLARLQLSPRSYVEWLKRVEAEESRKSMGPWVAGLADWKLFPTLTYDTRRLGRRSVTLPAQDGAVGKPRPRALRVDELTRSVGAQQVCRDLGRYVNDVEHVLRRSVAAVFMLEAHKSGNLHVHGLLGFLPGQEWLPGVADAAIASTQAWYRRHGYARVKNIERDKDAAAIAEYCAKYACKDLGEMWFSRDLRRR